MRWRILNMQDIGHMPDVLDPLKPLGDVVTAPRRTLEQIAKRQAVGGDIAARRRTLRLLNAEIRVREVREEALRLSPSLAGQIDWRSVEDDVLRKSSTALANADDARAVLAVAAARTVKDWPADEARMLLGEYLKSSNPRRRLWVAWALCGGKLGKGGRELLHMALGDEDAKVRVTAAYALLDHKDTAGLGPVFSALLDEDPDLRKLAATAFRKKIGALEPDYPIDDAAGPPRPSAGPGRPEPARAAFSPYLSDPCMDNGNRRLHKRSPVCRTNDRSKA